MQFPRPRLASMLAACTTLAAVAAQAQVLTLYYNERPPYAVTQPDGEVSGLTASPTARALRAAGIGFEWSPLPSARQLAVMKEGRELACGIGWFRNAEREAFAQFSRPVYQDQPPVALANIDTPQRTDRLADLLAQRDLIVLVKEKFSYGAFIDGLLAQLKPTIATTTVENGQMVQMIERHRVDLMFVAPEEAQALIAQSASQGKALKVMHFADVPAGEKRHLMCSREVPKDWIERFDAALQP